jgi:hypothetical protein
LASTSTRERDVAVALINGGVEHRPSAWQGPQPLGPEVDDDGASNDR